MAGAVTVSPLFHFKHRQKTLQQEILSVSGILRRDIPGYRENNEKRIRYKYEKYSIFL